ncbi:hypothetical protein CN692_21255 [Bacillus sp. AFS002410]|uniref:ATP synthase beta subunit C-terminal domain-containing protein n=1 Tax=Bacillus sp. AFS002410 TaxID=2033481 RepID=UPI000BF17679|nr:hypothetical protein [Bacillus sp. AFS002410]PEJ53277.1 hypothetical protein CN692_21255 [Bacillus sp. AFS002410]
MENLRLNVSLLRRRVPNLTSSAKSVGLRPATVSNLCTGKIPIGRSEVRTLVALATLAECTLDELIIRGEKIEMIETGIKTLDLFAPLVKGGTVGLVARPGMGQLVVLAEMFYKLKKDSYFTILLKPEGEHPDLDAIKADINLVCNTIDEVYDTIAKTGKNVDIAFAADRSNVISGEINRLQQRLADIGIEDVTTFLVDLKGEAVDEDFPYGPLETLWQFDADLAFRHKYPAINPIQSTSTVLEDHQPEQAHNQVQKAAQKLLRRYRELRSLVTIHGIDSLPEHEKLTYKRGELLEAYLTQPLFVAEEFTRIKGASVNLQNTLQDVRKLLDGAYDDLEVEKMNFIGSL